MPERIPEPEERVLYSAPLSTTDELMRLTKAVESLCDMAAPTPRPQPNALWLSLLNAKKFGRACYELCLPFHIRGTHLGLVNDASVFYSAMLTLTISGAWDPPRDLAALASLPQPPKVAACLKLTQIRYAAKINDTTAPSFSAQNAFGAASRALFEPWRQLEKYFNDIT